MMNMKPRSKKQTEENNTPLFTGNPNRDTAVSVTERLVEAVTLIQELFKKKKK